MNEVTKDLKNIDRPVNLGNPQMGWASDVAAEMLRRLGIKYISLNPGASYRGLHDSLVNYGENDPPMMLCNHEKIAGSCIGRGDDFPVSHLPAFFAGVWGISVGVGSRIDEPSFAGIDNARVSFLYGFPNFWVFIAEISLTTKHERPFVCQRRTGQVKSITIDQKTCPGSQFHLFFELINEYLGKVI